MRASAPESVSIGNPPRAIAGILTPAEIQELARLEPLRFVGVALREWGLILGSLWLWSAFPHPAVFVIVFLLIGTRQHALINIVHEGCHRNILRNPRRNDWVTDLFFAAPVLLETSSFRRGHMPHHSRLGDHAGDSEERSWINIRGWRMAWLLLQHFSGWTAVRAVLRYSPQVDDGGRPSRLPLLRYAGLVLVTNASIFGYCFALGIPFAYFYLWLYPLFSVALLLVSLLAIAQHQTLAYARLGRDDRGVDFDPVLTRTATAGGFERFVFCNIGAAYHHEHHLLPGVPATQLPRMHALLRERGFYHARPLELRRSYAAVLHDLILPPASEPSRATSD